MLRTLLLLLTIFPMWASASDGRASHFSGNPDDNGTRVKLWIPGVLIKATGGIVQQHAPEAATFIRMAGTTTIHVAEGNRKTTRHDRKANRLIHRYRKASPLVEVRTPSEQVQVAVKQRNGTIRKLMIVVVEDNTFVHIRMRCKISPEQLRTLIKNAQLETIPSLEGVLML